MNNNYLSDKTSYWKNDSLIKSLDSKIDKHNENSAFVNNPEALEYFNFKENSNKYNECIINANINHTKNITENFLTEKALEGQSLVSINIKNYNAEDHFNDFTQSRCVNNNLLKTNLESCTEMKPKMNYFEIKERANQTNILLSNIDSDCINLNLMNRKDRSDNRGRYRMNDYDIDDISHLKGKNQSTEHLDFTNSIYNVYKKKNIKQNKIQEQVYEDNNDEEDAGNYNIYKNKKPKKNANYKKNSSNMHDESDFLNAHDQKYKNNKKVNYNRKSNRISSEDGCFLQQEKLEYKVSRNLLDENMEQEKKRKNYIANNDWTGNNNTANENSFNNNKYSIRKKFDPPFKNNSHNNNTTFDKMSRHKNDLESSKNDNTDKDRVEELDKKLKGCDKKLIELIESEILSRSPDVKWDDIAGLEFAKKTIKEIIIWPMLRPDIFKGIRKPPKVH